MAVIQSIEDNIKVFYQQWSEDHAGEPAIIIRKYSDSISIVQEDREILISAHEIKAFIKELTAISKL